MKIQTNPFALNGMLDIPGGGPMPNDLSLGVVGIVDMTPHYQAPFLRAVTTAPVGGLVALGAQVTLTCPQGEAWLVVGANFTCTMAAAAVVPALELNIAGVAVAFIPGTDSVRANPYEHTVSYVPPGGLILSPGFTIVGAIRSTPNSAITGLVRALVRRLSVGAPLT